MLLHQKLCLQLTGGDGTSGLSVGLARLVPLGHVQDTGVGQHLQATTRADTGQSGVGIGDFNMESAHNSK